MLTKRSVWLGLITLILVFCMSVPVSAASAPSIVNLRHSSVTQTTARIDFNTSNPGRLSITKCGMQIRKAGGSWKTKTDTVAAKYRKYRTLNSNYQVGAGKEVNFKMTAGTKYEYRGFCVTGGTTYYSGIKRFNTAPSVTKPSVVSLRSSNVTTNSARVDFNTKNPSKVAVTHCGLQVRKKGTSAWTTKTDAVAAKYQRYNPLNSNYQIGSGREVNLALAAGTTYEYRGFCRYNGCNYYSGVATFKTTAKPASSGSSKTLSFNMNTIKNIGKQPKGSVYCSAYAISYARVIRGYGASNPLNYWSYSAGYVMWNWGGMTPRAYATQQQALRAVYDQINAGRPAIVYVYGSNTSGHYVTVYGYRNVTNANALSMSNFVMVDPDAYSSVYGESLSKYTGIQYNSNYKGRQIITF